MSRPLKLPPSRKFPPRMSQEELKARTTHVMKEKGANYHFQAQFYEATSHEVVGSDDPKFCTLQPKVKRKSTEVTWKQAYDFIYDFLEKHKMDLTLATLSVEFGSAGEPDRTDAFRNQDRDQYFAQLRETQRESLEEQVTDFCQTH